MNIEVEVQTLLNEFRSSQNILSAIGDEVRQYIILQMLASNKSGTTYCDGMRVGEIASLTNLSRPAISHHLKIMKEAGLISMRREGTKNYYYFDTNMQSLQGLISMLEHVKAIMLELPDRSGEDD